MTPTQGEPGSSPALFSLLLFSQPPRDTPSTIRTTAAVTGAHMLILALLVGSAWWNHRTDLPLGTMFAPPQLIDAEYSTIAFGGIVEPPVTEATAARSSRPAGRATTRSTPSAARTAGPEQRVALNRPRTTRRSTRLLGTPVQPHLPAPPVVPVRIPQPNNLPSHVDAFAAATPKPVEPVAPRGVGSTSSHGNGKGGNGDVENLSLDELARQPVFTPFTQAPELMNRAEVRAFLQTRYPSSLSARGMGGRAILWILIDPRGGIRKAVLLHSSGNPRLDDAALAAIDRMEFRPAINKGKRVPVWVQLPITFQPNW